MRQLFFSLMACSLLAAQHAAESVSVGSAIRGKLVAYRPADRASLRASHVLNKEVFLFLEDRGQRASKIPIKVVYEHFGYSDLPDPPSSEGIVFHLRLRRKTNCDESFGSFVRNAPRLAVNSSVEPATNGVILLNGVQGIPESVLLKCYVLHEGDIHAITPEQRSEERNSGVNRVCRFGQATESGPLITGANRSGCASFMP